MKKTELIYREILYNAIEKERKEMTQLELHKKFGISLSLINSALRPLVRMNAIKIKKMGFVIIDVKKILYYWASIRNPDKDIIYSTRIEKPIKEIEKQMPDNIVFTAFSAYRIKFKDVPADYSEVYIYGTEDIEKRFPKNDKVPNLFVLKKDGLIDNYGKSVTIANLFVDLWNLNQWYAKDFLKALEVKLGRILE